jgi:hypothetical protein
LFCRDPYLASLKEFGYNVIRLPKADIKPLQILTKRGRDLDRLGDLADILVAGPTSSLPQIAENTPAANISGKRTSELSLGLGLSILGTIIGAMGGSKLGLDAKYEQASTVTFEFQDILEDKVEVTEVDQFLGGADINPSSVYVADLLLSDQVFTTTATIKSTKFTVEAKKSDGTSLELNVPVVQQVVGADVTVSAEAETSSKVTYEGKVPLVFGFQAVQLFYHDGVYTAFEPTETAMRDLERAPRDGAQRLMTESPFVNLGGT